MQDYQAKAIAARNAWTKDREEAIKEIAERLAEIAVADFEFQVGARGCSMTAGFEQAQVGLDNALESVKSRADGIVTKHFTETRRARSATRNTHGIEE